MNGQHQLKKADTNVTHQCRRFEAIIRTTTTAKSVTNNSPSPRTLPFRNRIRLLLETDQASDKLQNGGHFDPERYQTKCLLHILKMLKHQQKYDRGEYVGLPTIYCQLVEVLQTHHFYGWSWILLVEKRDKIFFTLPTSRGHRQGRGR